MGKITDNIITRNINIKSIIHPFFGLMVGGCDCCDKTFNLTYILDKIPIYHCTECYNYDQCNECFDNKKESLDHSISHNQERWFFVNPNEADNSNDSNNSNDSDNSNDY